MKVILTGGGTGGHVYPALSLWQYIKEKHPDASVLYVGSEHGLEGDIIRHAELPFVSIHAAGLKRQLSVSALRTMFTTYRGYRQAKRVIKKFQPDIVIGTGGYVTLPVIYAASAKRVPSIVWESNARPGLTNQLCATKADAVAVSFEDSKKWFRKARRVELTGNPRASEVLHVQTAQTDELAAQLQLDPLRKLVVFFAGSRGSQSVNAVISRLAERFEKRLDWQLLFITGDAHFDDVMGNFTRTLQNVHVVPFIHGFANLLPKVDVLITRAGGATLAEICSLGIPSILIPSPYVTANHQEENARQLVFAGAAMMCLEPELTDEDLWSKLEAIIDHRQSETLRMSAKRMATPDAVARLYALVAEVLQQSSRK